MTIPVTIVTFYELVGNLIDIIIIYARLIMRRERQLNGVLARKITVKQRQARIRRLKN
jgi:heme exporter protein D